LNILKKGFIFWGMMILCVVIAFQVPISYAANPNPTPSPTPNPSPSPYQLKISHPEKIPSKYRKQINTEFQRVYPLLVNKFNPQAPKTIYLNIDNNIDDGGTALGDTFTLNLKAVKGDLDKGNVGVIIHELAHLAQPRGKLPSWIREGMADYAVLLFGTAQTNTTLPDASSLKPNVQFLKDEKYRQVTRFLLWVKQYKRSTIFDDINRSAEIYKEELFKQWTGQTLDQLYQSYYNNPGTFESNPQCYAQRNDCVESTNIDEENETYYYPVKKTIKLRKQPKKDADVITSVKKDELFAIQCLTSGDQVSYGSKKTKLWGYVYNAQWKGYLPAIYLEIDKKALKEVPKCKKE
jgi:hypothetical protein